MADEVLKKVKPTLWRGNPLTFWVPWVFLYKLGTKLLITKKKVILQRGIISKQTAEVRIQDIRTVSIQQGMIDRLLMVGRLDIASAGTGQAEISIKGISNPEKVKALIESQLPD